MTIHDHIPSVKDIDLIYEETELTEEERRDMERLDRDGLAFPALPRMIPIRGEECRKAREGGG